MLREVEEQTGIIRRLAGCFTDHRDEELIEHSLEELLRQRIFGLALGYEYLNDHDCLRHDPLLAALVGKRDPSGNDRPRRRDRGKALAGRNTLNRLELTPRRADAKSRYKKIVADSGRIESLFVDVFLQLQPQPLRQIVLDLDATDDPLHGDQLGKFFHGYYKNMTWCEANGVDYILGVAKNKRLERILAEELEEAKRQFEASDQAARVFKDFSYKTLESWSRERRVVGKAEHLCKGPKLPLSAAFRACVHELVSLASAIGPRLTTP